MSAPLTDLVFKNLVELGVKTILSNPDKYILDIFGDMNDAPFAALYGTRTLETIKKWIQTTKIPVILGFDLVDSQVPAVTIHLAGSQPYLPYIGDESLDESSGLLPQERDVLVPAFTPKNVVWDDSRSYFILSLPTDMDFASTQLFVPGLLIRDKQGREYQISTDQHSNITIVSYTPQNPVSEIDLTSLEVVSPIFDARFSTGAMTYDETINLVIHGHSSRSEGLWLYNIVMWTLLKFRPILTGTFGMDLSMPSSSDFTKATEFGGENVWRRYITVQAKTNWTWTAERQKDLMTLILNVHT